MDKKVILGKNTLWAYANVWEPTQVGNKKMYSIRFIISKDDTKTLDFIHDAMQFVYDTDESKLIGKDGQKVFWSSLKLPLRDGDKDHPDEPEYRNCYYLGASTGYAPEIVDKNLDPITSRREVYSGCRGRASVTFYAFRDGDVCGIACGLGNLQKFLDGRSLGKKPSAAEDFAGLGDDE